MQAPELTLEQKAFRTKIAYRFYDAHVEYTIVDSRGDKASFSVKYEDIPSKFDYRTFQPRRPVISIQLFVLMALTLGLLLRYPQESVQVILFMFIYGTVIVGASALIRRKWFRKIYTAIPTRNGKLLVLRNDTYDRVMQELESRRLKALRKYAMVDALSAPQAELRRLRWLRDEGAITPEEFASYTRALGSSPGPGPFQEREEEGDPLVLAQNSFRFKSEFAFHERHLEYRMNDGALTTFNVKYNDLPPRTDYRSFLRRDGLAGLVLCFGMLIALALVNLEPSAKYFETPEGMRALGLGALVYLPLLAALVYAAARFSKKEFTVLPVTPGVIRVLHDAQHDRVIGEMQNRRHAALRQLAVIDNLNSPQGELKKFAWLKEQGVISDREFEDFRQKLSDQAATRNDIPPPPKPPRETLH